MKSDNNKTKNSSPNQGFEENPPSSDLKPDHDNPDSKFSAENSEINNDSDKKVEFQAKKIFFYRALMAFNFFASIGNVIVSDIDGSNKADWMIACWASIQFHLALSGIKERNVTKIKRALVLMKFYLILMAISMLGKMYSETEIESDGRRNYAFSFDFEIFFGVILRMSGHIILNILSTMEILKVLNSLNSKEEDQKLDDWRLVIYKYSVRVFYFWNLLCLIAFLWNEYMISPSVFWERERSCVNSQTSKMRCLADFPLSRLQWNPVLLISTIEHIFVLPMLIRCLSLIYKGIETENLSKILRAIRLIKSYLFVMFLFDIWYHVVWYKNSTLVEMYNAKYPRWLDLGLTAKVIVMVAFSSLCRGAFYYLLMLGAFKVRDILNMMQEKLVEKLQPQEHKEKFGKMSPLEKLNSWPYRVYKYGSVVYFCWNFMFFIDPVWLIFKGLQKLQFQTIVQEITSKREVQSWFISAIGLGFMKCLFSLFLFEGMRRKDLKKVRTAIKILSLEIGAQFLYAIAKETVFHENYQWRRDDLEQHSWSGLRSFLLENLLPSLVPCLIFMFGAIKVRNILNAPKNIRYTL